MPNGYGRKTEGGKMRKFKCYDCGNEWEVPYGTGRPSECPKCKSRNIQRHPEDRGRFGMRRGACTGQKTLQEEYKA
jgi:predicted Zn-ribbon and HTH transcriptional regulator